MKELTRIEEMLLLTIWKLGAEAFGVRIRKFVSSLGGRDFTYGHLYSALHQLSQKGYVEKTIGNSAPGRGGRRRIYYTVTREGRESLRAARQLHEKFWDGISLSPGNAGSPE